MSDAENGSLERKYSFEIPPDPIPEYLIQETIKPDVVVVGGGISGISAAISAVEAGAETVLIEKTARSQGRGLMYGAIGSRLQKKLGIEIDPDEVILNLMKEAGNRPDQRLLRMWAEGSGASMDWLMDMTDAAGIKVFILHFPPPPSFNNANEYYPQYLATHHYELERRPGEHPVTKCMMDNALKKGVIVHFNTKAEQLIRRGKGGVTGLIAKNNDGDYVRYNTKAIVLCTGDYGSNPEMVAKYCPHVAHFKSFISASTGDGHIMAMWAGAVMEPGPHVPMMHVTPYPLGVAFLNVNIKGERFQNEDVPGYAYSNAVLHQPGRTGWQVFDSKYPEELPKMGIGLGKFNSVTDDIKEYPEMQYTLTREFVEKETVQADTIEELAEKMMVPADSLHATVTRYNELARLGKDFDFGKRADRLTTIDHPPYFAGKDKGLNGYLCILGGINVNDGMQALDKNFEPIPGLYLAGNTMGNRFGCDYPTMVPGISHGMCLHFGRTAGANAAKSAIQERTPQ